MREIYPSCLISDDMHFHCVNDVGLVGKTPPPPQNIQYGCPVVKHAQRFALSAGKYYLPFRRIRVINRNKQWNHIHVGDSSKSSRSYNLQVGLPLSVFNGVCGVTGLWSVSISPQTALSFAKIVFESLHLFFYPPQPPPPSPVHATSPAHYRLRREAVGKNGCRAVRQGQAEGRGSGPYGWEETSDGLFKTWSGSAKPAHALVCLYPPGHLTLKLHAMCSARPCWKKGRLNSPSHLLTFHPSAFSL